MKILLKSTKIFLIDDHQFDFNGDSMILIERLDQFSRSDFNLK